jgi:hypothetical protein
MTLTKNELRQLIVEEIDRQHLEQLDEGIRDYLKTAYKYYADLGRKTIKKGPGAAIKTFAKDMSDVGATDGLEWVAVIPVLGAPAGIVALGLRIAAEEYLKAAIGALVTAAAQVGGGVAARAGAAAGLPALLAGPGGQAIIRTANQILTRVAAYFRRIPRIGPSVVNGVQRIQGQFMAKTAGNIATKEMENEVEDVVRGNKQIMSAYEKVKNLPAAKQIIKRNKSKKIAANRKDNINETIYNILKGEEPVKISRSRIRKLVKESIKKSGIVLTEKMNRNNVGVLGSGDAARIGKDAYEVLRNGNEILLVGTHGAYKGQKYRLKLTAGKLPEVSESGLGGSKMMFNYENIIANVDRNGRTEKLRAAMFGPRQDGFVYKTSPQPHFEKDGEKMKAQPIEFFVKLEKSDAEAQSIDTEDLL